MVSFWSLRIFSQISRCASTNVKTLKGILLGYTLCDVKHACWLQRNLTATTFDGQRTGEHQFNSNLSNVNLSILFICRLYTDLHRIRSAYTCARPFSVSFLYEKEPSETYNVSVFALLHFPRILQSVWWLGLFWQSTHVLLCALITHMQLQQMAANFWNMVRFEPGTISLVNDRTTDLDLSPLSWLIPTR